MVSKHLSEVFGLPFQRVPNSGAFVGGKNAFRAELMSEEQKLLADGDIIVPKELAHVSFECKFYKDFSWNKLFSNKGESHLNSWIKQSNETTKRFWFIIFKINRQGSFVCFPQYYYFKNSNTTTLDCVIGEEKYTITQLDGFFENCKELILNAV